MVKSRNRRLVAGQIHVNTLLGFIFGLIFVSVILYFAVTIVNPTPLQINTFKTILALSAGGIGAVLPGRFEFKHLPFVRAGVALAVFAAVFFAPISVVTPVTNLQTPSADPAPVIQAWFSAVDSGNYKEAWDEADPASAQWFHLDYQQFEQIFKNVRTPLGANIYRRVSSGGDFHNPPQWPPGVYRAIPYYSKYQNSTQCVQEQVVLRATEQLTWKVFSYQISGVPVICLK